MNRSNNTTAPETGASIGYGAEYNSISKTINNNVYQKTSFAIGQVISAEKKNEMPSNSTLSDNRSAFAGYFKYNRNNEIESSNNSSKLSDTFKFDLNYNYIVSKNLNKLLLNSIDTNFTITNNTFGAKYYETREISNEHYLDLKYIKKFNNDFNFLTGLRKNLQNKFTESNFIEANYDSDCLKISLNLSKQFYYNEELKPSNNLNLTLILKPFGSPISPDLSSFLN